MSIVPHHGCMLPLLVEAVLAAFWKNRMIDDFALVILVWILMSSLSRGVIIDPMNFNFCLYMLIGFHLCFLGRTQNELS